LPIDILALVFFFGPQTESKAIPLQRFDEPLLAMHNYAWGKVPVNLTKRVLEESSMKLAKKIALITGGARGIGRAIARSYCEEGAHVVIADRLLDEARQVAETIGAKATAVAVDVSEIESIMAMAASVFERFGSVDILVNGAAISGTAAIG
jgi:glutamyl-tRNA reductase